MSFLNANVDAFSTIHIVPVSAGESPQRVIPISATEPSLDHPQENLMNIFEDNPTYGPFVRD